jgi:hypothetical protein
MGEISFGNFNIIRIYIQLLSVVEDLCIYYLNTVTTMQNKTIFVKGSPNFQLNTGF